MRVNKKWPLNYIEEIQKVQLEYDIVLVSQHRELLEKLNELKINYITVFPKKDCMKEYVQRYINRGNTQEYINKKRDGFYKQIDYLSNNSGKKWILEKGEYLEDRLIKEKIYLKAREK